MTYRLGIVGTTWGGKNQKYDLYDSNMTQGMYSDHYFPREVSSVFLPLSQRPARDNTGI
jgi:hypothetical protein